MPCNCGKKNTHWEYTNSQGRTKVYHTEIEAKAAQLRDNGRGAIRTVTK